MLYLPSVAVLLPDRRGSAVRRRFLDDVGPWSLQVQYFHADTQNGADPDLSLTMELQWQDLCSTLTQHISTQDITVNKGIDHRHSAQLDRLEGTLLESLHNTVMQVLHERTLASGMAARVHTSMCLAGRICSCRAWWYRMQKPAVPMCCRLGMKSSCRGLAWQRSSSRRLILLCSPAGCWVVCTCNTLMRWPEQWVVHLLLN